MNLLRRGTSVNGVLASPALSLLADQQTRLGTTNRKPVLAPRTRAHSESFGDMTVVGRAFSNHRRRREGDRRRGAPSRRDKCYCTTLASYAHRAPTASSGHTLGTGKDNHCDKSGFLQSPAAKEKRGQERRSYFSAQQTLQPSRPRPIALPPRRVGTSRVVPGTPLPRMTFITRRSAPMSSALLTKTCTRPSK